MPGKHFVAAVVFALGLAGCATPYRAMSFNGGVDDLQLNSTTFKITARGNRYTPPDRVVDYIMLRAAELTLGHGYKYFTLAGAMDASTSSTSVSPGFSTTVGNAASQTTIATPSVVSVNSQPGATVVIAVNNDRGIDAKLIASQLEPRYGTLPVQ